MRTDRLQIMDERVRMVLRRIEERWRNPVSTKELAREVSLSPSRLQHLFKQHTGQSITQSLRERRLEHAARLLAGSHMPIKEIAYITGFNDNSNFHRSFQKRFGIGPARFRSTYSTDLTNTTTTSTNEFC